MNIVKNYIDQSAKQNRCYIVVLHVLRHFDLIRSGADAGRGQNRSCDPSKKTSSSDRKACVANDIEACGKKCCYSRVGQK